MAPSSSTSQFGPIENAKKSRKPPSCDPCRARRVLCHPQPGGAACPRCAEKEIICTTTPTARGRPRKNPPRQGSSIGRPHQTIPSLVLHPQPNFGTSVDCPELSPEFVAHCLEGLSPNPLFHHPLISAAAIMSEIRAVSFQLHLLPPQTRVLALCSIAGGSLLAFHKSVLGDGPRPKSFDDNDFFSSSPDILGCGVRRAAACRALRAEALKAAWEVGIILSPSNENAASCYLLDLLEQTDQISSAGRPWATAYLAHARALAPNWRPPSGLPWGEFFWTAFLMHEGLISARGRTPAIITAQDQLFFCGPERSLETLLESLESSANNASVSLLWTSIKSYMFNVTTLARQLLDQITGDVPRSNPLSEVAVLNFLNSLSKLHSTLSLLLDRIDGFTIVPGIDPSPDASIEVLLITAAYGGCHGFGGLALPFYRELQYREACGGAPQSDRTQGRLRALKMQAHDMAVVAGRELARGIRYLPKIHYAPVHWITIRAWAEFVAEDADMVTADGAPLDAEAARDLVTFADELKMLGYSLDAASTPETLALIERLEGHANRALVSMFLPIDYEAKPSTGTYHPQR
ncbi:Zn(2)-C6 fungal-type domain-containing protein [Mycena venus]|uniref:Zn(2)-C6 fungal-type domain-containing protein n=1 Tax=Mycena venus TaxID=2733690 RepID=A0A8H6XXK4_9AGAR|nr:Zn(2)-C6 fungal-type domain-containing protein [Mycena venus]